MSTLAARLDEVLLLLAHQTPATIRRPGRRTRAVMWERRRRNRNRTALWFVGARAVFASSGSGDSAPFRPFPRPHASLLVRDERVSPWGIGLPRGCASPGVGPAPAVFPGLSPSGMMGAARAPNALVARHGPPVEPLRVAQRAGALRAYLRHPAENRIRDLRRCATRRWDAVLPDAVSVRPSESAAPADRGPGRQHVA